MNYPAAQLKKLLQEILQRSGSEEDEAALVADHLIQANLRGHDSHGAYIIGYYMECLKKGALKSNSPAQLVRDAGTMMIFDGGCGYGQRVAHEAVAAAIDRCNETGFVTMALRNSSHIGRVGAYGEQAAAAGFVSLHFVNTIEFPVIVVPLGGREPRFKTNPICFAIPASRHNKAIVLDFATSSIAFGKAYVAMKKGAALPENTIVDHSGRATLDPAVLFENPRGAMLPFGGHKGYGLLVFCELLAGILSGGGTVQSFDTRMEGTRNNMLSILIDPAKFAEPLWMNKAVDDFVDYVRSCPPVDPDRPVLLPGDMELAVMAVREKDGIPMDKSSWEDILAAAQSVGLARETAESMVATP